MSTVQMPLISGKQVDASADYREFLPVNIIPIPEPAPNAQGYFTNHPGITLKATLGVGQSNGAIYNSADGVLYRMMGGNLYGNDQLISNTASNGRVTFSYSPNTTAFSASNGKAYYWNGEDLTEFKNWQSGESPQGVTNYAIDGIIDGTRNLGRYIWLTKKSFVITDLQNEQRPDFVAPIYSAESDPDENVAVSVWRDFVVVFGRNSTEFFRLTGNAEEIYQAQRSLVVQIGCISTHAKCNFGGGIAVLGSGRNEPPQIAIVTGGQSQKISSAEVDKVLQTYNDDTLQSTVLESAVWRGMNLLYVHLPLETIAFVAEAGVWIKVKSGLGSARWTAIDLVYNSTTGKTECGDKGSAKVGELSRIMSQYDEPQEAYLQTPLFKVGKGSVYDLALDTVSGFGSNAVELSVSATENGYTYSKEQTMTISNPQKYTRYPLISRVGGVRDKLGFRLRIVTGESINISGFTARIENG